MSVQPFPSLSCNLSPMYCLHPPPPTLWPQDFRTFALRSSQPWLLTITPPRLQLPGGTTRPLGLTFDARAATTGIIDVLVRVTYILIWSF